jgi:tetratricopeptide (TPR) repeat protein
MSKIRTDAALAVSIIVVVLGSCIVYTAQVSAAVADDLIAAERLFHSRDDEAALEEAIAAYSALIENAELTVDQQYLCLKNLTLLHDFKGVNFCPERDQQMTVFQAAQSYAERMVEIAPERPDGHYLLAVAMGRVARTRGILQSLFMAKPMRDRLENAVELDPNHVDALRVLSMLYNEAPGWPVSIGNKQKALEYVERAYELNPEDIGVLVQLARMRKHYGKTEEAKALLRLALDIDVPEEKRVDSIEERREAQKLLSEWGD